MRKYKIPRYLDDESLEFLERYNPNWQRFKGICPTCDNTGEYELYGETHICEMNDFEHPQLKLFKLYCASDVPMEYINLHWDDYPNEDVAKQTDKYIDSFDDMRVHGMGLEIFGKKLGTGKSWMATYILRELLKMGYTGWYTKFSTMKIMWNMTAPEERAYRTRKMLMSELLVVEEIEEPEHSERQRNFFEDVLEGVIRSRTENNLPTITTTNMEIDEMEAYFPRINSLLRAKQTRVELYGKDYRVDKAFIENTTLAEAGERLTIT